MRIKRATYRHIEAEIYAYDDTLKTMRELRAGIIHAAREEAGTAIAAVGYVQSQVERRATRLADSLLLKEMERITQAIAGAYQAANETGRQIVWLKYGLVLCWEPTKELKERASVYGTNLSIGQMASILDVNESTVHRYRTSFVYAVAQRLGWW
jgi:RinA family phage transcriptional activator